MKIKYLLLLAILNYGAICFGSELEIPVPSETQKAIMLRYLTAAAENVGEYIYCDPIEGIITDEALSALQFDSIQLETPKLKELREKNDLFTYDSALHKITHGIRVKAFTKEQYWKENPHIFCHVIKYDATRELIPEINPFYEGY